MTQDQPHDEASSVSSEAHDTWAVLSIRMKSLSPEICCYISGAALVLVGAVLSLVKIEPATWVWKLGVLLFCFGAAPFLTWLYDRAWKIIVGKIFIVAIVGVATNITCAVARQHVASIIGTDPSRFVATVTVSALMLSPILFLVALYTGGAMILSFGFLASGVFELKRLLTDDRQFFRNIPQYLGRVIVVCIMMWGGQWLLKNPDTYSEWFMPITESYLYKYDLYKDPYYSSSETEKVALLGDGRIVVGAKNEDDTGYVFSVREVRSE